MRLKTLRTPRSSSIPHLAPVSPVFQHLLQASEFTEFALIVKRLTGLTMALNMPQVNRIGGNVPGDKGNPVCQMIRDTEEGARRCEACDLRHHLRAGTEGQAQLYTCHAGFLDMAIPIVVQGTHVATISSGQVLTARHSDAGFARLCRQLHGVNLPQRQLRQGYQRALWLPRAKLRQIMRLLEIFARQVCDSAWRIQELETSSERPEIRRAKAWVGRNYRNSHLQLAEAAAEVGLSMAHFSHLFHQQTGMTFTHYVQSRRMEEARRCLRETDQSITQICFACGFNSLTHFNRVFRCGEKCSPRQYRNQEDSR